MGFMPSWLCPKRPRAHLAGRCLSPGNAAGNSPFPGLSRRVLSELLCCTAPSALLREQRVMKSGISVRKLVEKGGANGLRPCWGARGKPRWKTPEWAAGSGSGGMDGRGGSTHRNLLSPVLWEAAPAALAWSQGSFVLQEKLCLPAVASLMLQILCKTACFKGCILGEAALPVWRRSLEVAGALQSSRDADYAKVHTFANLHL